MQVTDSFNNFIDFEVVNDQVGRWRYTGIHGYPERERRHEEWSMIRDLAARSSLLWCVIGYFNDLMAGNERQGGRYHSRNLLQGFSSTIFDCGLQDLGFQDENFTWERFRGTEKWV